MGVEPRQYYGLIAFEPGTFVDGMRVKPPKREIGLGAGDEECCKLREHMEPLEVEIAPVHNVECAGLRYKLIEDIDIVELPVAYMDKGGDITPQIKKGMQFDRGFPVAEAGPRKHRQTQIDRGGIKCIDGLIEFYAKRFVCIEPACGIDKGLRKVGIDAPIAYFVGVGQGVARHPTPNAHVIEFALLRPKTCFDVSETLTIGELREGHTKVLIEAAEISYLVASAISLDTTSKGMYGKIIHYL